VIQRDPLIGRAATGGRREIGTGEITYHQCQESETDLWEEVPSGCI